MRWLPLFLVLALVAPSSAMAEEGADQPPQVVNEAVAPSSLPYTGGQVTVSADVTDAEAVLAVYAQASGSDGSQLNIQLAQDPSGPRYSGTFDVAPNFTDSAVSYSVELDAIDTLNQTTTVFLGFDVEAQPQFDEAPAVSDPSVTPRELPAGGGAVTIAATATDNRSVSEVYATIARPDGTSAQVPLDPTSGSRFEGVFSAPANAGPSAARYDIEITALDDIGQPGTVDGGSVRVAAPASGLRLSATALAFRSVLVGSNAVRWVTVSNDGLPGSAPISVALRVDGTSFALAGGRRSLRFSLGPGRTRSCAVVFRPRTAGVKTGVLSLVRADRAAPAAVARLSGRAVAPIRPRPR